MNVMGLEIRRPEKNVVLSLVFHSIFTSLISCNCFRIHYGTPPPFSNILVHFMYAICIVNPPSPPLALSFFVYFIHVEWIIGEKDVQKKAPGNLYDTQCTILLAFTYVALARGVPRCTYV